MQSNEAITQKFTLLDALLKLEPDLEKILKTKLNSPAILFAAFTGAARKQGWTILPPDNFSEIELCDVIEDAMVHASPQVTLKYKREICSDRHSGVSDGHVMSYSILKVLRKYGLIRAEIENTKGK